MTFREAAPFCPRQKAVAALRRDDEIIEAPSLDMVPGLDARAPMLPGMTARRPAGVLAARVGDRIRVSEGLSGFGGLNGGSRAGVAHFDDGRSRRPQRSAQRDRAILTPHAGRGGRAGMGASPQPVMSATEATAGVGDQLHVDAPPVGDR